MSELVLELNDIGIGAARGSVVYPAEPGYALRDGDTLVLGADAMARARATPQWVSNRFWDVLDQETMPEEGHWRQTPAELAYAQLESVWARRGEGAERAMLIVPPTFTNKQLGLILGMCRKADIPVVSLVDSAVAALAEPPAGAQCVFVDLTLHRVTAVRCRVDGALRREAVSEIDRLGLVNFFGKWAAAVADACVRATRYDPMHSAQAEQELYDALPGLLERLGDADSVSHPVIVSDETTEISVARSALVQAVQPYYGRVVGLVEDIAQDSGEGVNVVLSGHFAGFPDLVAELGAVRGWSVSTVPVDAGLRGVADRPGPFAGSGDGVGLIVERPVTVTPRVDAPRVELPRPTHILVDGNAFVLSAEPFVVGTATRDGSWGYRATGAVRGVSRRHCTICADGDRAVVRDHSTYGTWVNGQRIDGERRLGAGDVIRVGNPGVELRLVKEIVFGGPQA